MKRFLYLLIILAVIAIVVALGYFFRYRSEEIPSPEAGGGTLPPIQILPTSTIPSGATSAGGTPALPLAPTQKFGVLAQNPVKSFFIDGQNNVFAVQPDGQIIKIAGGQVSVLSSSPIADLLEATFSFDGKKILAIFGNALSPQLSVFDVPTKLWLPLAFQSRAVAWSPQNYEVAYLITKNDQLVLTTIDLGNPKARSQELARFHGQDLMLRWVTPAQILLVQKSSALTEGSLWSFNLKSKTFSLLVEDRPGLQTLWGASASLGLVFEGAPEGGGGLRLIDSQGKTTRELRFLTLPSKCVFSVTTSSPPLAPNVKTKGGAPVITASFLTCAIPRNQRDLRSNPLPDVYEKKAMFTVDDFYHINLDDGNVESLFADPTQNLDATNLRIFNGRLFFVNRFDERLYGILLP